MHILLAIQNKLQFHSLFQQTHTYYVFKILFSKGICKYNNKVNILLFLLCYKYMSIIQRFKKYEYNFLFMAMPQTGQHRQNLSANGTCST